MPLSSSRDRSLWRAACCAAGLHLACLPAAAADFLVTTTADDGPGSLAQAIADSNAAGGDNLIEFAILGLGDTRVIPAANLPAITANVIIDGYSQGGTSRNTLTAGGTDADLSIVLDGTGLATGGVILDAVARLDLRGVVITDIPLKSIGVRFGDDASGHVLDGCFVGTDADGQVDRSEGSGVVVEGPAVVGPGPTGRNIISGNDRAGVQLRGTGASVVDNLVGADRDGNPVLGNGHGILVSDGASTNVIGDLGDGNLIVAGSGDGIRLEADAGVGNDIRRNRIFGNDGLGIDLGGDGVTRNDLGDADGGPNGLLNAPEITFAIVNNSTALRVEGLLEAPKGGYQVLLYGNLEEEASGFGEGEFALGNVTVSTVLANGLARFNVELELDEKPTAPLYITATARRTAGVADSSEFSRAFEAVIGGPEHVVTNTNAAGAGSLAAAIGAANTSPEAVDTVVFAIPGAGPHVIQPNGELGISAGQVVIDGYTQPNSRPNTSAVGTNADLRIILDGSLHDDPSLLGTFTGARAWVRGLSFRNASQSAFRFVSGSAGGVIEGCFIGTDISGQEAAGNAGRGIEVATTDVQVGGFARGNRMLVSGNGQYGIDHRGTGGRVINSLVGTDAAGNPVLGNDRSGVRCTADGLEVGSDDPAGANVIGGNAEAGVLVGANASGVTVAGNQIEANGELGIDLQTANFVEGVSGNDIDDVDAGGNGQQNFPEVDSAVLQDGVLTVAGSLDVAPADEGTTFRFRVFANEACDASGHGEGAIFVGSAARVVTAAETFEVELPASNLTGSLVTVTATREASGETSEFSACVSVESGDPLCGDADENGAIVAGDALRALKAAVGTAVCQPCACDVNDTGSITSSDALLILKKAVAQPVELKCPGCA